MPKRVGYLYEKMLNKDTIREAILEGSKKKRKRKDVRKVLADVDVYTERVYDLLSREAYVPTTPRRKVIQDSSSGKERVIQIVPFYPDGIIHRLAVMAMKDVLMRGMYRYSCASIPGRGNKCAGDYVRRAMDSDPKGTKYCLKMDIRHYYPSIDPRKLIWALARKIKDKRFLRLVYNIAASNPDGGLAIGYYTNQWLANFYLETIDNWILRQDGAKHYVRNMDDMIVFGPNKKKLHKLRQNLQEQMFKLGLHLKGNHQVFPTKSRPVDFVGYRYYRDHTTLRRRNFLRFARQCRRVTRRLQEGLQIQHKAAAGLLSRKGELKHCDGLYARQKYYDKIGDKLLLDIVSSSAKTQNIKRLAI